MTDDDVEFDQLKEKARTIRAVTDEMLEKIRGNEGVVGGERTKYRVRGKTDWA